MIDVCSHYLGNKLNQRKENILLHENKIYVEVMFQTYLEDKVEKK